VDGARFYACQGLKEVMSKTPRNAPGIKDLKRRAEVVSALVSFIERKPPFTPSSVEEADGLCMIRREAIRALALVREPMIAGAPNGHVALCLARVVGKDASLTPVPRLDERLEASIGLGRLLADAQNDFQPGYAVNLIGQFVVEFGQVHKDRGKIKNFQREPWKVHAARLDDALKDMAKTFMKENMVASIQNLTNPIFEAVIRGSDSDTNALSNFVAGTPPAMKQVYKSDPKSVIAPRPVAKE
jgi:hypothetical protein